MSYGGSAALQAAIYARLGAFPALAGVGIYDAPPPAPTGTFVLIGPEEARDASDQSGAGAEHLLLLSVISEAAGFAAAKAVAEAVSDALLGASLSLARGRIVALSFERAIARRIDEGTVRRIDLRFRARVEL